MAVGITDGINMQELRNIASPPRKENENWWKSPDFQALTDIKRSLTNRLCPGKCHQCTYYPLKYMIYFILQDKKTFENTKNKKLYGSFKAVRGGPVK